MIEASLPDGSAQQPYNRWSVERVSDEAMILDLQARLSEAVRSAALRAFDAPLEAVGFSYPPRPELGDLALTAPFDLARSLRFRWFDQPAVDEERSSVLAGVRGELVELSADDAPDRARRIEALAAIPEQIVRFLAERLADGIPAREPMLEVLVRRHYREHELHDLRVLDVEGRPFAVADCVLDADRPTRLVTTVGTIEELADEEG